jgi:hypothetical protein
MAKALTARKKAKFAKKQAEQDDKKKRQERLQNEINDLRIAKSRS